METLLSRLQIDYPNYNFTYGTKFSFRYPKTIKIGSDKKNADLLLLHELGHAILGHKDYLIDIDRLKMEVEAWEKARELANFYGILYDEDIAQNELNSYRDWLHKKSRCPSCGLTRFQDADGYHCPLCENLK